MSERHAEADVSVVEEFECGTAWSVDPLGGGTGVQH